MSLKSALFVCAFLFAISSWSKDLNLAPIAHKKAPAQESRSLPLLIWTVAFGVGTDE